MRKNRMAISTSTALVCLAFHAPDACAGVQDDVAYQSYHAHAERGKSLYSTLVAATPFHENGRAFIGHTSREIHWQLHWTDTGGGNCRIDDVRVMLHTTIVLPQLDGVDPDRQAEYTRFYTALHIHESGHYRIEQQMAATIDRELAALPEAACSNIESLANAKGRDIVNGFNHKEEQYDAETDHGRTQGAFLKN